MRRALVTLASAAVLAGAAVAVVVISAPAAQAAVTSGTTYTVVGKASGKCVDARAASSAR